MVYSKETNLVIINVVNRHKDKEITAEVINSSGEFIGKAEVNIINSSLLEEQFTYDKQEQYLPVTKYVQVEGNKISYSFPAHSFTQIKVGIKK